jgi:hypothetical protein
MKAYGEWMYRHTFSTSTLVAGDWSASRLDRFTPGTHLTGGWVDSRAGLDYMEKYKFLTLLGLELRPLGLSARSLPLYGLQAGLWDHHAVCESPPHINLRINQSL